MYFLVNELSFTGQFTDKYEANDYMDIIRAILKELKFLKDLKLLTHQSLSEREMCPEYKVRDWLKDYTSYQQKDRDFLILMAGLFKAPCISTRLDQELENDLYYWECHFNQQNYFASSLAGAVYLKGNLVSLQKIDIFNKPFITVRFKENDEEHKNVDVPNIFELIQAQKIRPKFRYHPKHHSIGHWNNATPMDLSNDEAQDALDQSLLHEGHTQRYSFYKKRFYVFQDDNAGGYHGYPVDESQVPSNLLKQLKDS